MAAIDGELGAVFHVKDSIGAGESEVEIFKDEVFGDAEGAVEGGGGLSVRVNSAVVGRVKAVAVRLDIFTKVKNIVDDEGLASDSLGWGAGKVGKVAGGECEGKKSGR